LWKHLSGLLRSPFGLYPPGVFPNRPALAAAVVQEESLASILDLDSLRAILE